MTKRKVSESVPVQVYLNAGERSRLDRLSAQLDGTKSEIIRRALAALEREVLDPIHHPALSVIGMAVAERAPDGFDAARNHDSLLADNEVASWVPEPAKRAATKHGDRRRGG